MNNQEEAKIDISVVERSRIFLASPYTHKDEEVMTFRYEEALRATARLINIGYLVFSPVVHCHPIAVAHTLPRDYKFWQDYSDSFLLNWAEAVNVLCLPGWMESKGVKAEINIGGKTGLPVYCV